MKFILKSLFSIVFILSAIAKLWDFMNTVGYFSKLLNIDFMITKYIVVFFIFAELIIAFMVTFNYLVKTPVYKIVVSFTIFFLFFNLYFLLKGYTNCGCFGTEFISSPVFSIIKNAALLFILYLLNKIYRSEKTSKICL